jgi:L-alanine-DL-glutamate epimerase-like enolase superfamily enzyme
MKITNLRVRRIVGTMIIDGPFWEERLLRPIDIYPEYRRDPWRQGGEQLDDHHFRLTQHFLDIETDTGLTGRAGPLSPDPARLVLTQLSHLLIGQDPMASERLWDQMHRFQVHGRQGDPMIALSAVDCGLWDIKGQALGHPVWRLLGGGTRTEMPAYVSMLGYAVDDLGKVRERAQMFKEKGFTAQKWFFRHGPMSGFEGLRKNVALVRTLRDTLGDDYDIMLDCWQGMSYDYAVSLCERIEQFRPRWLEEPFMPDRIDTYCKLKSKTRIPLAGAEHEYTRWGFKRFIEKDALDILQPDAYWCGGLSEAVKIANYATVHDLITIPHGHSTPIGIHFSAAQSPIHTPYQEYLAKWNDINMHFLKHPLWPEHGLIRVPEHPGVGMALDPDKIEREDEIQV